MTVEYIGLDTYLFTFPLEKKSLFDRVWEVQEEHVTVTEVFINNKLAFEVKLNKQL